MNKGQDIRLPITMPANTPFSLSTGGPSGNLCSKIKPHADE